MKLRIFLLIFLLAGVSCRKNRVHPVPSIAFEIQVDMNLPTYQELTNVGGWAYVNGGLKGIIIYRQSVDVFVAWERMSPEDPEMKCESGLVPDSTNFLRLNDPCSNAVFSMYDGSPIANSDWGLRQYRTEWGGSNLLRVYN